MGSGNMRKAADGPESGQKRVRQMAEGKNSITTKMHNRGLVLKLIATKTCHTRTEIARQTGLAKMTVTNIVQEFLDAGIVEECEEELTEVCGRNPIVLQLSEKAPKVIGLLIFRGRIEAVLCDLSMRVIQTESIRFEKITEGQLIEYSYNVIDRILFYEQNILGIGAAVIGPFDIKHGILLNPPRFYGIHDVNIKEFLQRRYDCPIYLDHDNNSAALAEKLFGAGREEEDFIFLGVSNGVGSGIISNGQVYHNRRGLASEIGHVSIDRNGIPCSCGSRGCLELYASSDAVLKRLREKTGLKLSYRQFLQSSGNPETDDILEQMLQDIGVALVNSVNLLQPGMIILGHDCLDWEDRQVKRLEAIINEKKMAKDKKRILVRKAHFGKNAQLIGAAANAADQAFKGVLDFCGRKTTNVIDKTRKVDTI